MSDENKVNTGTEATAEQTELSDEQLAGSAGGTDMASMQLAQFAINGNSPGTAEIDFVEVAGGGDSAGERETEETKTR